jgi:methylmalonyl-CoA mutase
MSAVPDPTTLADLFEPSSRSEWLALVEKTLKGASVDSLESRTADGLPLKPLYAADDAPSPAPQLCTPGGWDIRAEVPRGPDSNTLALEALAGGATSLLIDATDGGERLELTLEGVVTEIARVALDAGFAGPTAARALDATAKASPGALLAFHLDPLSAFAREGVSPSSMEAELDDVAALAARLAETYPKASLFLASGVAVHEGGGTPAAEIAFAAAAAVTYARALTRAGLPMAEVWSRIILGLSADAEPIVSIAKLRAARRVWNRITQACETPVSAQIEARASRRMLTIADYWTNLVRLTTAAFSGAVGGADALVLGAFTNPLGAPPESLARRQSRNTQLILREEAKLGAAADPAFGSWALEAQTDSLAHAAWDRFVAIEREGGLVAALKSGAISADVERARADLAATLAQGARRIVGVTDFKSGDPPAAPRPPAREQASVYALSERSGDHCPALTPIRLEDLVA